LDECDIQSVVGVELYRKVSSIDEGYWLLILVLNNTVLVYFFKNNTEWY